MTRLILALLLCICIKVPNVYAQNLSDALVDGIARESAGSAEKFLQSVPERLSDLIASKNKEFDTVRSCLSELQLFINAAVVVSDLMPFSNVWTQEIDGSAYATFRLMVDGERTHARISCDEQIMVIELLDWDASTPETMPYRPGALAASLGVLLTMNQRGELSNFADNPPSRHSSNAPRVGEALRRGEHASTSVPEEDVNQALSGALGADTESPIPSIPLTAREKDGLRVAVQSCWNVGSLTTEALRTTVALRFSLDESGRPVSGSFKLLDASGGSRNAASQAYEAARRAIIRCGSRGYDLPKEKYEHWREIELIFDPTRMRIR